MEDRTEDRVLLFAYKGRCEGSAIYCRASCLRYLLSLINCMRPKNKQMSSVAKLYGGNPGLSPAPVGGRRRRMSRATRRMRRMRGGVEEPMPPLPPVVAPVAPVPPVVAPVAPVPPVPSAPPEEVVGARRRRSRRRSRRHRHRSRRYRAGLFA